MVFASRYHPNSTGKLDVNGIGIFLPWIRIDEMRTLKWSVMSLAIVAVVCFSGLETVSAQVGCCPTPVCCPAPQPVCCPAPSPVCCPAPRPVCCPAPRPVCCPAPAPIACCAPAPACCPTVVRAYVPPRRLVRVYSRRSVPCCY